jgi:pimeloyl-ACP methyl ester carboxylesterase
MIICALDDILQRSRFDKPIMINLHSTNNPILLVHGSSGSQIEWKYAIENIKRYMPDHPTYAFSMDLHFDEDDGMQYLKEDDLLPTSINYIRLKYHSMNIDNDIKYYVNKLDRYVTYIAKKHEKKIILIGHSMGGLIANQYSIDNHKNNITTVISISTPICGASILNIDFIQKMINSKSYRQMHKDSKFLSDLYKSVSKCQIPRLTVGSENDMCVHNMYSMFPKELKINHIMINGYGHSSIITCEDLWINLKTWIDQLSG